METPKDYIITSGNVKFPNFNDPEFEEKIREKVDENVLLNDVNTLIDTFNNLEKNYIELISSNKNNFNDLTESYYKKTYNFLVIIRAMNYQFQILKLKITLLSNPNDENSLLENLNKMSFNLFFDEYKDQFSHLILSQYKNNSDKEKLIEIIENIIKNSKEISNADSNYFGINILDFYIKYSIKVINTIISQINKFSSLLNIKSEENQLIYFYLIFSLEKLDTLNLFIKNNFLIPKNDIFNLDEDSKEWKEINKLINIVIPKNEKLIHDGFNKIEKYFNSLRPIITYGITSSWNSINILKCAPLLIKYKLFPNSSMYDSKKLEILGCDNLTNQILNIAKIPLIKKVILKNCPKIYCKRKLYLKRLENEITENYIKSILPKIYKDNPLIIKEQNIKNKKEEEEKEKENEKEETQTENSQNLTIENLENPNSNLPLYLEKISKPEKKYYTSTRLFHSSSIYFSKEIKNSFQNFFCKTPKNNIRKTLLLHIHGGGFVSMTTTMHESYLRKWSNKLKIPILGLNYHLSPEVKYPKAIDDIYQSYIWIIKNGKKELNLDFEYLILSGDSAGGSLLLSLIFLLIYKNKFENLNIKLPDLIIAQYPCCNTSIFNMNYSLMLSLKDFLLNDDFLKYVYYSYRGNYLNDNDPFLNPEKVTLDILKFLPRTRFFFGGADPLRDDIIRLIYKISQVNNLDFKAYQFQFYAHGFYGLDNEVLQKNPTEILLNEIEEFLKEKNC